MKTKCTPGPWVIVPLREHDCDSINRRCQYETDDGLEVCAYSDRYQIQHSVKSDSAFLVAEIAKSGKETLANARLISQAPALLEALRGCVEILQREFPRGLPIQRGTLCEEQDFDTTLRQARAAIARAEGGAE